MPLSLAPSTRRFAAYAALAVVVCGIVEVAARALLSSDFVFRKLRGFDAAWQRLEWVRRAGDPDHKFTYTFDVYDARRGWATRPGLRDMLVFDSATLNTNVRGLRGIADHTLERRSGVRRVVVLGDSFTFGDEVSDDVIYARQLETLLPNTEVINLGVHGYGHDQMLLFLHDEGVRYRPDVVLLGYVWFDTHRGLFAFNNYAKPRFELENDALRLNGVPVPKPARVLASERFRSRALDLLEMAMERVRWQTGINDRRALALSAALIDSMAALARGVGAVPVIAYLPVLGELLDTTHALSKHERDLDEFCRPRQLHCVFLRPRFTEALRAGATFDTRRHWKATEHRIAAATIRDYLVAEGLATASPREPQRGPPGP